jgi:hypothetical protein
MVISAVSPCRKYWTAEVKQTWNEPKRGKFQNDADNDSSITSRRN